MKIGGDTCAMTPQLHSLYEAGVASLRGWTVFHLTVLGIIPPPKACRITQTLRTQTWANKRAHKEQRGGWGWRQRQGERRRRHSTKKAAAACVNWLMLPPLCQINSTGQGRDGGRERVRVGGWVQSFHQRAFLSPPSLSFSV